MAMHRNAVGTYWIVRGQNGLISLRCSPGQAHIHTYSACIQAYIHTYIDTYIHTYIHTYMHAWLHACVHACMHAYMHT